VTVLADALSAGGTFLGRASPLETRGLREARGFVAALLAGQGSPIALAQTHLEVRCCLEGALLLAPACGKTRRAHGLRPELAHLLAGGRVPGLGAALKTSPGGGVGSRLAFFGGAATFHAFRQHTLAQRLAVLFAIRRGRRILRWILRWLFAETAGQERVGLGLAFLGGPAAFLAGLSYALRLGLAVRGRLLGVEAQRSEDEEDRDSRDPPWRSSKHGVDTLDGH
jgi:hypothetical protein